MGSKITQEEMHELFGEEIPIEAIKLLHGAPAGTDPDEIRAKLRKLTTTTKSDPLDTEACRKLLVQFPACLKDASAVDLEWIVHRLEATIDEVERLRAENAELRKWYPGDQGETVVLSFSSEDQS